MKTLHYRTEIDGLRALAIIPVLLFHTKLDFFQGGFIGVDIFFVISGFLITSLIFVEKTNRKFSFARFYIRRIRRILPMLLFVILVTSAAAWIIFPADQLLVFAKAIDSSVLFYSNIHFWRGTDYFGLAASGNPLIHTWSLSIEEQFYLLFPLAFIILISISTKHLLKYFFGLWILSFSLSLWGSLAHPVASFYLLPTRGWELLSGSIISLLIFSQNIRIPTAWNSATANIGLILLGLSFVLLNPSTMHPGPLTLLPVLGTCFILLARDCDSFAFRLLRSRPLVFIGLISYSLYLWHQPQIAFANFLMSEELGGLAITALLVITLVLSTISFYFLEKPFRNASKVSNPFLLKICGVTILILLSFSAFIKVTEGFAGKYSENEMELLNQFRHAKSGRGKLDMLHVCHLDINSSHTKFLENNQCLTKDGILVVGDSHAADKAIALRLSGLSINQFTGDACSISPNNMTNRCRTVFDFIHSNLKGKPTTKTLVLSNQFSLEEVSKSAIEQTISYWSQTFSKIVIFSNMPSYKNLNTRCLVANFNESSACFKNLSPQSSLVNDNFFNQIERLNDKSITVIDTEKLFCSIGGSENCSPMLDGKLLLIDDSHLSPYGAEKLGEKITLQYPFNN